MTWNRAWAGPTSNALGPEVPASRRSKRTVPRRAPRPRRPRATTVRIPTSFATLRPRHRRETVFAAGRGWPATSPGSREVRAHLHRGAPLFAGVRPARPQCLSDAHAECIHRRDHRRALLFASPRRGARFRPKRPGKITGWPLTPNEPDRPEPRASGRPLRSAAARARGTWVEATAVPGAVARGEGARPPCSSRPAPMGGDARTHGNDAVAAAN